MDKQQESELLDGHIRLSPSIKTLESKFKDTTVSAWKIVLAVFELHPEYASGKATNMAEMIEVDFDTNRRMPFSSWLQKVISIYDHKKVSILNGRLLILGLGLLEQDLGNYLNEVDVIRDLAGEIEESLIDLLPKRPGPWAKALLWSVLTRKEEEVKGLEKLSLSLSIRTVIDKLGKDLSTSPGEIVKELLELNPEYGNGKAKQFIKWELITRESARVGDWILGLRKLFDSDKIPQLHGRLVIIGLTMLSPELKHLLLAEGFLNGSRPDSCGKLEMA